MRKFRTIFSTLLIMIFFLTLLGCATLQDKWNKATDDERARIILSQTQSSLKIALVTSSAFVAANPKYKDEWKTKVLPMFEVANNILGELIKKGQVGQKLTYMEVLSAVGGKITDIVAIVQMWGVKVSELDDALMKLSVLEQLEERRTEWIL
jgi:hypothetical protein